jgi:hypothetical protein
MPMAPEVTRQKRGRKPTWRDGYLEQTRKLAALGATEAEMAQFFGVSPSTRTLYPVDPFIRFSFPNSTRMTAPSYPASGSFHRQ